tara:strand:- start:773 stop:958 length:186 start_codon:yes stop_codon:yes gene_type:complete
MSIDVKKEKLKKIANKTYNKAGKEVKKYGSRWLTADEAMKFREKSRRYGQHLPPKQTKKPY